MQPTDNKKEQDKQNEDTKKKDPSKIRCKKWPMCKDQDCLYAHPKETCKHFPHCMYGDKCINIHPSVPCKFGYSCTKPNCPFVHPAVSSII